MRWQANHYRKLFAPLIGVALCLLQIACSANRSASTETELVIGARADDYVVEPLKSKLGMYPLNVQICEPLVRITSDYQIEPLLATRWEVNGNTWRFFLVPAWSSLMDNHSRAKPSSILSSEW